MFDTRKVIAETLSIVGAISPQCTSNLPVRRAQVELAERGDNEPCRTAPAESKVERETVRDGGDSSYSITWAIDGGEIRKRKETSSNEG
jgi:hypothetical protein